MLSNNPAILLFLGVFAVGAIFFALGSMLVRAQQRAAPLRHAQGDTITANEPTSVAAGEPTSVAVSEPTSVAAGEPASVAVGEPTSVAVGEPASVTLSVSKGPLELRLDYVERLAIVGAPWCVDELEALRANDADALVRDAADAAIIVIRSRGY